jgi:hypothetical protein
VDSGVQTLILFHQLRQRQGQRESAMLLEGTETIHFLLLLAIIAILTTFIMMISMKSRVLHYSRTRVAVHDVLNSPTSTQSKKPMKQEAESRAPFGKEHCIVCWTIFYPYTYMMLSSVC